MSDQSNNQTWKTRWVMRRNAVLGSARFQQWAARIPIFRWVARRRAAAQFDLVAGFVYSQILAAFVEAELVEYLNGALCSMDEIADFARLEADAAERLIKAAAALDLAESPQAGLWTLGQAGAELSPNIGAMAMIRHHHLLYQDLSSPLNLLAKGRRAETALSAFWTYASKKLGGLSATDGTTPNHRHPVLDTGFGFFEGPIDAATKSLAPHQVRGDVDGDIDGGSWDRPDYSALMAATQPMVSQQIIDAYDFSNHRQMLDIGGGSGAFVSAVAAVTPSLQLGIFDLPKVVAQAESRLAGAGRITIHGGSFKTDPVPTGYDLITLSRILHDHDDDVATALLGSIHAALPPGGTLLIVEPMSESRGARRMGDAYFGLYLWAMNSGRPRSAAEIHKMLAKAGFSKVAVVKTALPIITSALLASK
jgi:demethylspheroidene O-methyltransferase